jgi:hypothetical protein
MFSRLPLLVFDQFPAKSQLSGTTNSSLKNSVLLVLDSEF